MSTKRKFLVPVILVAVSISGTWIWNSVSSSRAVSASEKKLTVGGKVESGSTAVGSIPEVDSSSGIIAQEERLRKGVDQLKSQNPSISIDEAWEMVEWQEQHGYPLLNEDGTKIDASYDYYDKGMLKEMARQGDALAMLTLGRAEFRDNGPTDEAKRHLIDASVHGYTASLADLGNIAIGRYRALMSEGKTEQATQYAIEAYAWFDVGLRRGDVALKFSKAGYGLKFNDDQKVHISRLADHYYSQLVEKRDQLGLPPYSNTTPDAMRKLFGEQGHVNSSEE